MKFRDRLGMFVLTKQEQRTIAFIVLMLCSGSRRNIIVRQHPHDGKDAARLLRFTGREPRDSPVTRQSAGAVRMSSPSSGMS